MRHPTCPPAPAGPPPAQPCAHLGGLWIRRAGAVGVCEQRLDGGQDAADVVAGAPRVLDDVEAQRAVAIDVGVEDLRGEPHPRRLLRVRLAKGDAQLEHAALRTRTTSRVCVGGGGAWSAGEQSRQRRLQQAAPQHAPPTAFPTALRLWLPTRTGCPRSAARRCSPRAALAAQGGREGGSSSAAAAAKDTCAVPCIHAVNSGHTSATHCDCLEITSEPQLSRRSGHGDQAPLNTAVIGCRGSQCCCAIATWGKQAAAL